MKKIAFDKGWRCYAIGKENEVHNVSIPHDAMLYDDKSETSPAGVNTGWYEANDYVYENIWDFMWILRMRLFMEKKTVSRW